jgi:7-cyano-7-deazaguanine synthase
MPKRHAVVLLSGGLDSATALAVAATEDWVCHALSFRYGQRHEVELQAAGRVAESMGVDEHRILDLPLGEIGGSSLTDPSMDVPTGRSEAERESGIPSTYVPARNTIFLSFALALAEVTESDGIFIGVNAVDFSGYPDCRPEYIDAWRNVATLATRRGVEGRGPAILAPLMRMSKAGIIRLGSSLGVDYSLTVSCYNPDEEGRACGRCDSCVLRRGGFRDAGVQDPTRYQEGRP